MLQSVATYWNSGSGIFTLRPRSYRFRFRANVTSQLLLGSGIGPPPSSRDSVLRDSLRVLEWDKICDAVAGFAGTALGKNAAKELLWRLDLSYEESQKLLAETASAVEMIKYGAAGMELSGVDVGLVKSAIGRASRGLPINGIEAITICAMLELAETLQMTVKTATKEDPEYYNRFMPISQVSSELKRFRDQVRGIEQKLYQLMDRLIRTKSGEAYSMELSIVNGRWCIKSAGDQNSKVEGLLLSSAPGANSFIEPLPAVALNDELQQTKSLVLRAEEAVLSKLTDKIVAELDGLQSLLETIVQLDVVFARAKYGLAFGGTFPLVSCMENESQVINAASPSEKGNTSRKLSLRKTFHPLLLKKHYDDLQQARKDVTNAASEMRRARLQGKLALKGDDESVMAAFKTRVAEIEERPPVPIDFLVSRKTNVIVITGPNTGGKTIGLKTIGLAAMMAKSGLYVLASEPAELPWFDAVFADIGDEQSLAQSLSTFSGHLKQISAIRSQSTNQSLVLLDEVGAGTNPLEGAALGMSLLESFSLQGALLTFATTHHGELKTLKYSNKSFENACVEFDEVNLKPTYKILWGVPGRSNAINVAERLGLPGSVLERARQLYGTASAEINGVIVDMERLKQEFHEHLRESQHYLKLARRNHEALVASREKLGLHAATLRNSKAQAVRGSASVSRSLLHTKLQQFRERSAIAARSSAKAAPPPPPPVAAAETPPPAEIRGPPKNPAVGEEVYVPSLGRKAVILELDSSKGEIVVISGNMKLRLKLSNLAFSVTAAGRRQIQKVEQHDEEERTDKHRNRTEDPEKEREREVKRSEP